MSCRPSIFVLFPLIIFVVCFHPPLQARASEPADAKLTDGFKAMLKAVDEAQVELQNGRPAPYKALWSHADDITLSGGLGGKIERGWEQISRRLDWVGTQFSDGTNTIERLVAVESCDLGYVVQQEHLRFRVPGQPETSTRDYRVTMVFRRESDGWKLVHRQADSQMTKQPTK